MMPPVYLIRHMRIRSNTFLHSLLGGMHLCNSLHRSEPVRLLRRLGMLDLDMRRWSACCCIAGWSGVAGPGGCRVARWLRGEHRSAGQTGSCLGNRWTLLQLLCCLGLCGHR